MTLLIHALWWQVQPSEKVYSCKYSGNCFIQEKLWNTNGKHRWPCKKWFNQNEQHAEQNIAVTNTIQYWYTFIKVWWILSTIKMFSLLYWNIKTGSEQPVVGNNSVTARRGSIVQLKDTSFWSLPDNTVYTGHLTESSSSKLTALPTTGTRK